MNVSFYNGVSGVKSQQFGIDTWGNNIANVNTIGYKYSDPQFASILSQAVNTPAIEGFDDVGLGSTPQATALNFQQGIVKNTDREFDLAIQGKGFFGVLDGEGSMNYTRNGAMYVNGNGYLVDQFGNFVLGQKAPNLSINSSDLSATVTAENAQPTMSSPGSQQKIQIPLTVKHPGKPGIPEERTSSLVGTFDYVRGETLKYNYYTSADTVPTITVTDANGVEQGKIYLDATKKGNHDKTWDGKVTINSVDADGNPALNIDGTQKTEKLQLNSGSYTFNVEYVSKVATPDVPEGNFAQYQIDVNGKLIAQFDNGMESTIAQLPVYQFQNEQGLTKVGDSLFQVSDNSGQAFFYKDANGDYLAGGTIMSSSLEMSNVSLATALTELMVTQKAFDANAKSITTSDQMIQKALSLKRG